MIDRPNIFDLLRQGRFDEFLRVVDDAFQQGAARGHRRTLAIKAAMERFAGNSSKARELLNKPQNAFGGDTAFDRAGESDEGLMAVLELLEAVPPQGDSLGTDLE